MSWEILDAWRDAAEECGIPKIEEFNRGDNFGNAYFQMNQRRGVRWSATKAFLRPGAARGRTSRSSPTRIVERMRLQDDGQRRARNRRRVRASARAASSVAQARREVDPRGGRDRLAADPAALGRRPGRAAAEHGIDVVHDLPGVGANLHDHLQIRMHLQGAERRAR